MLPTFARLVKAGTSEHGIERAALVIDIPKHFLSAFGKQLKLCARRDWLFTSCFLEASDDALATPLSARSVDRILPIRTRAAPGYSRGTLGNGAHSITRRSDYRHF